MRASRKISLEQTEAEASVELVKRRLGPFVVAAETTRMPMVFTDAMLATNPIIFANDAYLALTAYGREEILGQDFDFLIQTDSGTAALVSAAFSASAGTTTEVYYHRKDQPPIWVALFITPVRDADGEVVQHFASFVDLSSHKEEQVFSKMLIAELNHRVKNTLATVKSIVAQGLKSSESLDSIREAIDARIFGLSRSHDLLARENWRSAGLLDVVYEALQPFERPQAGLPGFLIDGDNIRLSPNVALALGIAVHELATNAVKYGALSNLAGTVSVKWRRMSSTAGAPELHIEWREAGGPAVVLPSRFGFGTKVIQRGLTHELQADTHLEYAATGLVCTLHLPLTPEMTGAPLVASSA